MLWITFATLLLMLLVNLPLIYSFFAVHGSYIWKLWGYAPHQFLFLLVPLPIATFATLVALVITFNTISNSPNAHAALIWCGKNWIVIILLGFMLSTAIAILDFYSSPKVFDRLKPVYAERSVSSSETIMKRASSESDLAIYRKQAESRYDSIKSQQIASQEQLLSLNPDVFLLVAKDAELQRRFSMLDEPSHLLSELQLIFGLFVGFGTLFAAALFFLSHFSQGIDLSKASPAIITSLAFLAFYPLCFGYWASEINFLTGKPINNMGYLIVGFLIIAVGLLIILTDSSVKNVSDGVIKSAPAMFSILALLATKLAGIENLRSIIGIESTSATRLIILIALLLVGLILCAMLVIQYEGSFHQTNAQPSSRGDAPR